MLQLSLKQQVDPSMRFVAVKSEEAQVIAVIHRIS